MKTDHGLALAVYRQQDDSLIFTHTEVPPADEGKGHASALVKEALDDTRRRGVGDRAGLQLVVAYAGVIPSIGIDHAVLRDATKARREPACSPDGRVGGEPGFHRVNAYASRRPLPFHSTLSLFSDRETCPLQQLEHQGSPRLHVGEAAILQARLQSLMGTSGLRCA